MIILLAAFSGKLRCSQKNKDRTEKVKRKIFWNALIRYLLVNALKFYIAAFVVIKKASYDKKQLATSILMIVSLSLAAIVMSITLFRKGDDLFSDE